MSTVRPLRFTQFLIKSLLSYLVAQPDCFLVNIIQGDASSFVVLRTPCATAMLVGSVNVPVGGHLLKCFFFFLFSTYL